MHSQEHIWPMMGAKLSTCEEEPGHFGDQACVERAPSQNAEFEAARLTIRLGAIERNFRVCQRLSGPAAVAAVVKADAYGLGMREVARRLADAGCDTFFVARLQEALALRPLAPEARIFVLDGAPAQTAATLIAHRLTPALNSLAEIAAWSAAAKEMRRPLDAAIHVDTGMNRLGLPREELLTLAAEADKRLDGVRVALIMSHLACAEDPNSPMNGEQLMRFKAALQMLPAAPASLSSTGGILLGKNFHFDIVRPGLGLYGGNPQDGPNPFSTAVRLTSRILQLRRIEKGETAGYGATFRARRPTTLATVALGYADGLFRTLSNRGFAAIAGRRAPFAGRVSMDLVTLDVTDIPPAALCVGAEAEFIGDTISPDEIAAAAGTAPYEILTSLARRAGRHYETGA
ncbi:MAG TPA: alanine racemase [Rhizomicrobium sp.]|nr:alanine racemase [Rhizomicrobium sp.]